MTGPRPDSKSRRIEAFFAAHPDEWLTWEDMVQKFDLVTIRRAQGLYEYLRTHSTSVELETVTVIRVKEARP